MIYLLNEITKEIAKNMFWYEVAYIEPIQSSINLCDMTVVITDIANALKRGKKCEQHVYYLRTTGSAQLQFLAKLEQLNESLQDFCAKPHEIEGLECKIRQLDSNRVYSPFVKANHVNKPVKWSASHIWKAINTGQITEANCTMKLTDDYIRDYENNYGKGRVHPKWLAKQIVEDIGWTIWNEEEDRYGITKIYLKYTGTTYSVLFDKNIKRK